jgi:hypothetical protein
MFSLIGLKSRSLDIPKTNPIKVVENKNKYRKIFVNNKK